MDPVAKKCKKIFFRVRNVGRSNDRTVEIELTSPFPLFLSVLAGATAKVLPAAVEGNPKFFDLPIGSGAFRLVSRAAGPAGDLVFERYEGYNRTKPALERLILRPLKEPEAIAQALAGKVHDLANYPLTGSENIFKSGQHLQAPVAATWIIGLNTRLEPFRSRDNRKAFRDSIDAEAFRLKFFPDAVAAHGYIPPGLPGFNWDAETLQAHAGPLAKSKTKIRIAIPDVLARSAEMKSFFEEQLRSRGWNAEAVPMEWNQLMEGYSNHTLQGFLISMNMDYPDTEFLVRNFDSTHPDNFSGIKSGNIDRLIQAARATQSRALRQKIYSDLVTEIRHEALTVDLFHPRGHYWVSDCVSGIEPNLIADYYIDYRTVKISDKCRANGGRS